MKEEEVIIYQTKIDLSIQQYMYTTRGKVCIFPLGVHKILALSLSLMI